MLIWKNVIEPGVYWYNDPRTGEPRSLDVGIQGVRYWYDQGKAMLDAGLSIPVPLEHQMTLGALTKKQKDELAADLLRNNAGWVKRYHMKGSELWALLSIEDPGLYAKLPKTIKYVSPWITSFMDGDGRQWNGVFSHIALTSRPRITRQRPFADVAAALSLAQPVGMASPDAAPDGVLLSRAGLLDRAGSTYKPHYGAPSLAFSIWTGITLAGDLPVPEKKKGDDKPPEKKEGDKPATDGPPPDKVGGGTEDEPVIPGADEPEANLDLVGVLRELVSAIFQVELPATVNEQNLASGMVRALLDKLKMDQGAGMGNQPPVGEPNDLPPNPAMPPKKPPVKPPNLVQESPQMYMSLEEINAIADPTHKATAMMVHRLAGNALAQARGKRQGRVDTLAKRLATPAAEQLKKMAEEAALSLNDDGTVNDAMDAWLSMMEASLPNLPQILTTPAGVKFNVEAQPADPGAGMSEEKRQSLANEMAGYAGIKERKAG